MLTANESADSLAKQEIGREMLAIENSMQWVSKVSNNSFPPLLLFKKKMVFLFYFSFSFH